MVPGHYHVPPHRHGRPRHDTSHTGVRRMLAVGGAAAAEGAYGYYSRSRVGKKRRGEPRGTSDIRGNDIDRGIDSSTIRVTTGHSLHKRVIGEPIILHEQIRGVMTQGEGLQGVFDIKAFGSVRQWNTNSAVAGSVPPDGTLSLKRWFDLNPSQRTTGGNIYPAQIPADDKLYLQSAVCEIDFGDFANLPTELEVYVFQCKKDAQELPLSQLWYDALGQEQGTLTAITLPGRTAVAGFGPVLPILYGAKPQETRMFNQFYKTLKHKKLLLARGSTEKLKFYLDLNLLGDQAKLAENLTAYPKGSVYISVIVKGSVILDNGSNAGSNVFLPVSQNASYSSPQVGYVINTKYKFRQLRATVARQRMAADIMLINNAAVAAEMRSMGQADQAGGVGEDIAA